MTTRAILPIASLFWLGCFCTMNCAQVEAQRLAPSVTPRAKVQVSPADAQRIGRKIWQNECGGTVEGLTSWNKGEAFASLGIGHFIWYPAGARQTYQESFPGLLAYLQSRQIPLPDGLSPGTPCPWPNRDAFMKDINSGRLRNLRVLLRDTVPQQTEYIVQRMHQALPKMLAAAPKDASRVERQFTAVAAQPNGLYALIDYVNFKGEGTNPKERYNGHGWGMLQVLQEMKGNPSGHAAVTEYAAAAKRVLGRRIANAPKPEGQWKSGWFSRCDSYARPW